MAFTNETVKATYNGNGVTATFAIPFTVIDDASSEVVVHKRDLTVDPVTQTLQVISTNYTIVGDNVIMNVIPTTDEQVVISRALDLKQTLDLQNNADFVPETQELHLDMLVAMIQQVSERADRAPIAHISEQVPANGFNYGEPIPSTVIGWNDDATQVVLYTFDEVTADITADLAAHLNDTVDAHDASTISNAPSGNLIATNVQTALNELQTNIDLFFGVSALGGEFALVTSPSGKIVTSAVTATELGYVSGVSSSIQGQFTTAQTNLANHVNSSDAHDASDISVVPAGNLASSDVQAALEELQLDIDTISGGGSPISTTDDLPEGVVNFYYTETRFNTSFALKDTDDLTEGSTNFYYTTSRFNTDFALKTTTNLTEGTNLYYTDERVDDRVASLLVAGTGIALTYNDGLNTLTIDLSGGYTDEQAQDAVGAMVANSTKVSLIYVDGTPSLTADIIAGSLVNADIAASAAIAITKIANGTANQLIKANAGATANEFATLSGGTGLSVTFGAGTIALANTGVTSAIAGTGIGVSGATGAVTISNTGVTSLIATANQTTVSGATGAVTIGTVQSIGTGSSPTFTGLTLSGLGLGIVHSSSGGLFSSSLIVNADVSASAAIAYSKLNLALSIVNADVSASAAIAYSKLNLALSIVDADVSATAFISRTKLANGSNNHVVVNNSSGVMASEAQLSVSRGGTAASTLTLNNVILGNGTSAVQFVAPGSSGNLLTSNGTTWTSAAPAGASIAIGSTVTSGTATRVLFVDTGPVLADDSGFTFNKTSNVATLLGGLSGGTANTDNLNIYANDTAYVDTVTGSINIKHRIKFSENFTAVGSAGGVMNEQFINLTNTITSGLQINFYTGYTHNPTINVSVAQILSGAPAFKATPKYVHTVANLTDLITYYAGFDSIPSFDTTAATGTSTPGFLIGYSSTPRIQKTGAATITAPVVVGFGTFSTPFFATDFATGVTITSLSHFRSYEPVASGATVTNYIGFQYISPSTGTKPTITNEFGFWSDMASGAAKWNLYFTGTGKSFMQGGLRIGDASPVQPTEKLEVVGNAVLGLASTTTGELHFANSSNASLAKIKAPTGITGTYTLTLPVDDGTANQVLKTDGSGVLSWTTVSGSGNDLLDGSVHTDTAAGTVARGDVITGQSGTAKWTRLAKGTAYQALVMDSSATDVAWGNVAGMQLQGSTGTVSGTATVTLSLAGLATCEMPMPFAGIIYAMSMGHSANRTAGTCTARYLLNGTADATNTVVIDGTNVRRFYLLFSTPVTFAAGDYLSLETVTSAFTPTGNDALVTLFLRRT